MRKDETMANLGEAQVKEGDVVSQIKLLDKRIEELRANLDRLRSKMTSVCLHPNTTPSDEKAEKMPDMSPLACDLYAKSYALLDLTNLVSDLCNRVQL